MMKSILLVEDNDLITKLYKDKLEKAGYNIDSVVTTASATELLLKNKYDLVLLDIMLPGGENGFDLLEKMKKDERLKSIPVIVVTNLDDQEKIAKDIGADDCLVKSNINLNILLDKISALIGK